MKKSKEKAVDMSERDFLSAMYEEDMPTQNCVTVIYEHWEKMRDQLPTGAKVAITKKMKFFQRIAKIDPKALPMLLAIDPEYNPSLSKYA